MRLSRHRFSLVCIAVFVLVFGLSYTFMSQAPGEDDPDPGGNVGGETPGANPIPGGPGADDPPGPVGQVNELYNAVADGDMAQVRLLLADGADTNLADDLGDASLHWAVAGSSYSEVTHSLVAELLTHGANPNLANSKGLTPLHYAAMFGGSDAVVKALVDAGANPAVTTAEGIMSPYEMALHTGNSGAVTAMESVPITALAEDDAKQAKAYGTFSTAIREGLKTASTAEERETVLQNAVAGLQEDLDIPQEDADRILQELLAQACGSCDESQEGGE